MEKLWTYQELAGMIQCHPRTVARWCRRLNLKIFHPFQTTVRVPDSEANKLLSMIVRYDQATFPFESHHEH
jgi:DNA-binding MurR/RpiR family transcriptional regulator